MSKFNNKRLLRLSAILTLIVFTIAYIVLSNSDVLDILQSKAKLQSYVQSLGYLGPLLVVLLMTIAIIMSPIPSAPIALAAGAVYGHTWGTVYVLIGSELGAIIAFLLARMLGIDILRRWLGARLSNNLVGSQNTLMGIVFFSRLMPFLSFDIISYAAGLTSLSFWRFAIATLAGIAPASFILAHFGSEMTSSETDRILYALVFLGIISLALWLFGPKLRAFYSRHRS